MSKIPNEITGKAYVLGDNVDTDQIIPAEYLTFNPVIRGLQDFEEMVCTAFKHTGCKHSRVSYN